MRCRLDLIAAAGLFAAHAAHAGPAVEPQSHARRHVDDVVVAAPCATDRTRDAHTAVLYVATVTVDVTVCVAPEPAATVPCPEYKADFVETAVSSPEPCGCDDDDDGDDGETRGKHADAATPSRVFLSESTATTVTTVVPEETEHIPPCDEGSEF
ncbi:hypothetical protein A9K55_006617 [Cordyceps militaris]|uniref:Uncharacterized protein n=1 Tax=Cordyceps militaris TaxID=73501 RepID=A0A2H4SB09_CORMI|nr:hypothetical protein A9K55_006617 [Cordyceps militaris]